MNLKDHSDVEQVRAFNKGDPLAFEEFMRRHPQHDKAIDLLKEGLKENIKSTK